MIARWTAEMIQMAIVRESWMISNTYDVSSGKQQLDDSYSHGSLHLL
jgi:hypothetical protein